MSKLKRSSVFLLILVGLLATSGIALAGHEDTHAEDTEFSFGYDLANHILSLNLGPNWDPYVCDYGSGPLVPVYDTAVDGVIPITGLTSGAGPWVFDAREDGLLANVGVAAPNPASYGGAGNVCALSGVVVVGPNGQINHGQFMKAAKNLLSGLFEGKGQGCVVRYLAKSDIGSTDTTRLQVSDVPDPIPAIVGAVPVTYSEAFQADCDRGKKATTLNGASATSGRPDSPGKSGEAPGHNKP